MEVEVEVDVVFYDDVELKNQEDKRRIWKSKLRG